MINCIENKEKEKGEEKEKQIWAKKKKAAAWV